MRSEILNKWMNLLFRILYIKIIFNESFRKGKLIVRIVTNVVFHHPVALSQVFFICHHTILLCNNFIKLSSSV
jgi:uncharacterized membrane protein (DUF485 family)